MPVNSPTASASSSVSRQQAAIAILSIVAITLHLVLLYGAGTEVTVANWPLLAALLFGGVPLVWDLLLKLVRREFGSDLIAGISIVTSVLLGEYLAGTLVVLMLSGGEALESYAVQSASSVLQALAKRMPSIAHCKRNSKLQDIALEELQIGDVVLVLPHEVCPIDGTVLEGHGVMDESYLTGEPYMISKTPGSDVMSGAINGESALTIRADKLAIDSRYAKIMKVMQSSQQHRPRLRRLGDQLGAIYTPVAVSIALAAWLLSGDPVRFLAVLVVATPCPLLIAIPVAIIGSISLAARRAIIVRDPAVLEQVDNCQTMIFDKTGTLTYGQPELTEQICAEGLDPHFVLALVSSIEQYSKHPLSTAIVTAGRQQGAMLHEASEISERPGEGLTGVVSGKVINITSRTKLAKNRAELLEQLPPQSPGLECIVLIDKKYAATYQFRDKPRREGALFVHHLAKRHGIQRVVLLSGDRESEVQYLAELVGISEYYGGQSPEDKLAFVTNEASKAKTIFVGDGINDAPALLAATVGIAFGQNSDVTSEASGVVIMDSSLAKVDEFMHISRRMRRIALQSAVGGMVLSLLAMLIAAAGYLPPVAGAITQEVIDVAAVLNALRVAIPPKSLVDF
ncbi:MAG: heavy metal translocating P-type ATPase [Planctomycetaceae bacterium]|nr:heavy metal translocating P-type ATPase [Planctomycetaceae bacterium]